MVSAHKDPGPRLSWSLLAAIPRQQLFRVLRKIGRYDPELKERYPGRLAEELLGSDRGWRRNYRTERLREKAILDELSREELVALARKMGLSGSGRGKSNLVEMLLERPAAGLGRISYEDSPDELRTDRDLRAWVAYYIKEAETDGHAVDLNDDTGDRVAATIRFVCDIWPSCAWPDWLMWQRYKGFAGQGPWWIVDISNRPWSGARMILQNPWDFPFSHMHKAARGDEPLSFTIHTPRKEKLTKSSHRYLARAIVDGMRYDYDDPEFMVFCTRSSRALHAVIELRRDPDEYWDDPDSRPGEDGVYWEK